MTDSKKEVIINRIALLYKDLLSDKVHSLPEKEKEFLLQLKPINKILAIGDIDLSNWTTYPLTYMLDKKLVNPTVLDESKIYQSIHAMRTCNKTIAHPQLLISECVVIRIIGYDNSPNINDYINSFINMCIASDKCKLVFVIVDGDKRFYKSSIYTRKTNSSFIDYTSTDKSPVKIESTPLIINPDNIIFFNYSKRNKNTQVKTGTTVNTNTTRSKNSCSSILNDPDFI